MRRAGFFGRLSMNFHGSYIDVVGAGEHCTIGYYDTNSQVDLSLIAEGDA